jgi:hypothetical protein
MLDAGDDVFRLLQEDASGIRQCDVLPTAIEQLHADGLLELTNLLAQRRLSRAKACRRMREAQLFGDRDEIA